MRLAVERADQRIADGKVVALRAEDGQDARLAIVLGPDHEQRNGNDREEHDGLGDENGG